MPGLLRGMARTAAVVGTAQATRGAVARRQHSRWAEQDQASSETPPPQPVVPQQPAAPATSIDSLDQLERLAALKAQGILTDQEFADQKARILGT